VIGPSNLRKSIKPNPLAEPIKMFGGSPIKVAVPPIFAERTPASKNIRGETSSASATRKIIGAKRSIVVTLSRKAEKRAIVTMKNIRRALTLPLETLTTCTATNSKNPVVLSVPTTIIMPIRILIVLKSTR